MSVQTRDTRSRAQKEIQKLTLLIKSLVGFSISWTVFCAERRLEGQDLIDVNGPPPGWGPVGH